MRRFRFGLICDAPGSRPGEVARRAEGAGYSTVLFPDRLGMLAPFPVMVAAAATDAVRVGTQVLNVAFRPLGLLAQEAATLDALSGGRLELGIGAGHAEGELRQIGLDFPAAGRRIRAVGAAVPLLRRAFGGETVTASGDAGELRDFRLEPLPPQGSALPVMVGGNGDALLRTAAECADIVQFTGFSPASGGALSFSHFSWDGLLDRVALVRAAAGERGPDQELSLMVQWARVTDRPMDVLADLAPIRSGRMRVQDVADSPFLLVGTAARIAEHLRELRDRAGISYVTAFDARSAGLGPIVERLACT